MAVEPALSCTLRTGAIGYPFEPDVTSFILFIVIVPFQVEPGVIVSVLDADAALNVKFLVLALP